jgi:hypothetical protein
MDKFSSQLFTVIARYGRSSRILQLFILLSLVIGLGSCDGKSPKFVEQKITSPVQSVSAAETDKGFGLINTDWAKDSLWNHAVEVAEYLNEEVTENGTKSFTEIRLTRRYWFSKEFHTISEDTARKDLYPVIAQQAIASDAAYPCPTQTSTWVGVLPHEPFKVVRYIASWQGEGGISNKALLRLVGKSKLVCQNSFGANGEGEYDLQYDTFFEDQIPLSLRSLNFQENLEFVRPTLVSQLFRGADLPKYFQGDYKVEGRDTVETKLGRIACWKMSVERGMKKDYYWFEEALPHILVKAELASGISKLLQKKTYQRLVP